MINGTPFYALLGHKIGIKVKDNVPLIIGMKHKNNDIVRSNNNGEDKWKSFCAAHATTSSSPMFNDANVAPEARNLNENSILNDNDSLPLYDIDKNDVIHSLSLLDKTTTTNVIILKRAIIGLLLKFEI